MIMLAWILTQQPAYPRGGMCGPCGSMQPASERAMSWAVCGHSSGAAQGNVANSAQMEQLVEFSGPHAAAGLDHPDTANSISKGGHSVVMMSSLLLKGPRHGLFVVTHLVLRRETWQTLWRQSSWWSSQGRMLALWPASSSCGAPFPSSGRSSPTSDTSPPPGWHHLQPTPLPLTATSPRLWRTTRWSSSLLAI